MSIHNPCGFNTCSLSRTLKIFEVSVLVVLTLVVLTLVDFQGLSMTLKTLEDPLGILTMYQAIPRVFALATLVD